MDIRKALNLNYDLIINTLTRIFLIIIIAIISYYIILFIINRVFSLSLKRIHPHNYDFIQKRQRTIKKIVLSLWRYFVYFITFLMCLATFGINIQTILTGAGIFGVIIAVGSQHLLQDFLEGFFNVFENNISDGDYVVIDNVEGNIIDIGLRSLKIKSFTGEVHIIPNSKIGHIINYSLDDGKALVDVLIDYDSDLDNALIVIESTLKTIRTKNPNILSEPIIQGVNKLQTLGYEIRMICKTVKETHWSVQRFIRGELIKAFKHHNINIGINQIIIKEGPKNQKPHNCEV